MIGLDTNVILRLLLKDDVEQSELSKKLVQAAFKKQEPIFISNIVLCELIWVLQSHYRYSKTMLIKVLEEIIFDSFFEFENRELVTETLEVYSTSKADFSDCLIGLIHRHYGCRKTYSFDAATHPLPYFEKL